MLNSIFTFDIDNFYSNVVEGIKNGTIVIRDGVAYYVNGGIAQHLPLKEITFDPRKLDEIASKIDELTAFTQNAHVQQLVATGLSTTLILGAIIIQTKYLANKIDKLQTTIDKISHEIKNQNLIFYMEIMAKYFGVVETARIILLNRDLVDETQNIADNLIPQLAIERNSVLSMMDNLISHAEELTEDQLKYMLDFMIIMLELLPKSIYLESLLCDRYKKFKLAEHLIRENASSYNNVLKHFRAWCNTRAKNAIRGIESSTSSVFYEKNLELKQLFENANNTLLLEEFMPITLKAPQQLCEKIEGK